MGKKLVEKEVEAVTFTSTRKAYMERIQQVYRHYTVNDQNTLGMNGFLKFLKDLNLLKNPVTISEKRANSKVEQKEQELILN